MFIRVDEKDGFEYRNIHSSLSHGFFGVFCFLVLEEESAALIHHLPAGLAAACVLESAFGMRCRLVEAVSTSYG
jgi:hypothetical protein